MIKLYSYFRSQATFRVRIALNIKGLAHENEYRHLEKGEQYAPDYQAINPQMMVPTFIDGPVKLTQSLAILEYLDETHPEPALLPKDALARAWVRAFALINAADSHPFIVPRIRNYLTEVLKVTEAQKLAWIQHWLDLGLQAMEALVVDHGSKGRFCHGDSPTIADICLVTQVFPAAAFKCDLAPYPNCQRIYETCMAIPAFDAAHPMKQPDAE